MDEYAAFAAIYDDWASHMTEDVPFYLELVREADGPVVELAVGNGRVAVPIAQETGRRIIGIDRSPAMLALAREKAAEAEVELELHEGDMRDFELDEPAALVYCPFRAMLHLPTWSDKRRVFERVAAALAPGGRFVWNSFVFNPRIAAENDGEWAVERGIRHRVDHFPGRQPPRHHARVRRQRLALVGDEERVGRADRRVGARGGGALRRLRARAVRRAERRVRLGREEAAVKASPYDRIAELYDPWSRSVVEDVGFYVAEARKSGGAVVELGIGTGRIAIPIAETGKRVIGVDSSREMLAACRRRGRGGRRRRADRPAAGRPSASAAGRAGAARHLPVPLVPAPGRRRRPI